ncbi:MAG: hypothetical protein RQ757_04750 [Pseudomonadales bacterium]|nr:hypothetical protein [Pseudomonadales bacterium]
MLLDRLQQLAVKYVFLRRPVQWSLLPVLMLLAWLFLSDSQQAADSYQIPVILLLLWLLTLYAFFSFFVQVPLRPDAGMPWRQRWGQRLRRAAYGVLALLMSALSLALLVISAQLVSAWIRMY